MLQNENNLGDNMSSSSDNGVSDTISTASGVENEGSNDGNTPKDRTINPSDHDRAVQDMLKYKGQVQDLKTTIDSLQTQIHELNSKSLKDKEDYKSLYEQEVQNHQRTKDKLNGVESSFYTTNKHSAVLSALRKAGLRDDAEKILDTIDFDSLEVETTSEGRIFINGVTTFVEQFKQDYPFAFQQQRTTTINSGGGSNRVEEPKKITPAMIVEAEKKYGLNSKESLELIREYSKQRQNK
jgi:hypothetical protein